MKGFQITDKLNRQLRSGISPDDLANLHDAPAMEPRILCSLGLKE